MGKIKNACAISPTTRKIVMQRDNGACIVCGTTQNIQIAHYRSRGRLGLGIPENLACLCVKCHFEYDNGKYHNEIKSIFAEHLKNEYPDWDESKLVYKKWE